MSDYVANIRQKIGRDLLLLQAASVLAFDDDGRVLLGRSASGTWSTIGGAIELGETPADAALREFWEETGACAEVVRLLGVFGGPEFFVTYPNADQVAYTSIAFEVRIVSGAPAPDKVELQRLAWFCPSEPARTDFSMVSLCARFGYKSLRTLNFSVIVRRSWYAGTRRNFRSIAAVVLPGNRSRNRTRTRSKLRAEAEQAHRRSGRRR